MATTDRSAHWSGSAVKLVLAWGLVGIPLAWGVIETCINALKLFR
jgi:hypothetical protein